MRSPRGWLRTSDVLILAVALIVGTLATVLLHREDQRMSRGAVAERLPQVGIGALILEPAMNGAVELVESLRAVDPELPVIAVSVYPSSALPVRIDWTSYHLKPFGLAVLRDALAAHVPVAAAAA